MRRIGVLQSGAADNPDVQVWLAAFLQRLLELGWSEGRNLRIEYRLGALGDAERTRKYAAELVALAPDVIFASGTAQVGPLLQATRTVPIIFAIVADRSAPASLIAWRGQAATPPALSNMNMA